MTLEPSQAEVFPLIRGGGLFLLVVGLSIVVGAFRFRARYTILAVGAAIAAAVTTFLAAPLAAPFGRPDLIQILSLAIAVAVEAALLVPVLRQARTHDERETTLAILTIVGGHFLLMAPAFGPLIVLLAFASVLNTLAGLLWQGYRVERLWALDGVLKTLVGGLMFFGHRVPCVACLSWPGP